MLFYQAVHADAIFSKGGVQLRSTRKQGVPALGPRPLPPLDRHRSSMMIVMFLEPLSG